jgi:hypothetical protein
MNTCDVCKHWFVTEESDRFGTCLNEKLECQLKPALWREDCLFAGDTESYPIAPITGPKFGCIHWLAK